MSQLRRASNAGSAFFRLLALASPACSYCGRRLPENYIKARSEDLHRIGAIGDLAEKTEADDDLRSNRPADQSSLVDVVVDWLDVFR
jgi:hypothetical protein